MLRVTGALVTVGPLKYDTIYRYGVSVVMPNAVGSIQPGIEFRSPAIGMLPLASRA